MCVSYRYLIDKLELCCLLFIMMNCTTIVLYLTFISSLQVLCISNNYNCMLYNNTLELEDASCG